MLYKPEAFEPLTETPWDEADVRARVDKIADDTEAAYDPEKLWPAAEWDAFNARTPLTTLYAGASGIAWALARLGREARAQAVHAVEAWRESPDFDERPDEPPLRTNASLYFGETGPLAVAFLLGEESVADDLYTWVAGNAEAPANELMWAQVGTMLVAKAMHERTGDERWREAWDDSAAVLRERRDEEGLWDVQPFGRGLGAAHGSSTTAKVLGEDLELTGSALAKYAVREDGLANWPMVAGDDLVGYDGEIRTQWCHGAPGTIASSAGYLDEETLLAGAELCWQAGPPILDKGYGLCHGTAGTGYAFLKVFERTGDERWLERARRFAVHALEQVDRAPPRYSLMTGSIGAALFAADCVEARATVPIVDVL
jgi:lanthionine synthetase-like protein